MPKFKIVKEGVNDKLLKSTTQNIEKFLTKILGKDELIKLDNIYSFDFGSIRVQIKIVPYHSEDVLVEVFSYLAEHIKYNNELGLKLLRLNATMHFGAFGVTFDNSVIFSYSIAGANIDFNEFYAAVQTVATVSDSYDEIIKEMTI